MANSKYTNYSSGNDNSSSGDNEYERDVVLKWKPHATFRGVLDALMVGSTNYGQSLGIKFNSGRLVDGVLMERVDGNGEPDGTLKLFPWESMPVILGDDLSADDAPDVFTEEFGGKTYRYQLKAARVEETEDPAEPIEFADFMLWESGGKAPSAAAKIFAQLLSSSGRNAIADRDDIHNWLNPGVELRDDLIGREVDVFKITQKGDQYDFHSPVVIDVNTGTEVRMNNRADQTESPAAPAAPATDGGTSAADVATQASTAGSETESFPTPVQDFVDFCRDFGLSDEAQIIDNLGEMASEDSNPLTTDMVDEIGEDAIVAAIVE